jgi:hypothetical protein
MSDGFGEREKNIEARWAHDEDLRFRSITRRNKLFGKWAAGEMGLAGSDGDDYVKSIVDLEVKGGSDDEIVMKIRDDLAARNIVRSEHLIRNRMKELAIEATNQIMNETKA